MCGVLNIDDTVSTGTAIFSLFESSGILLTAKVTRSVKQEIKVDTFRNLPIQRPHFADLTRRCLVIKHGHCFTPIRMN